MSESVRNARTALIETYRNGAIQFTGFLISTILAGLTEVNYLAADYPEDFRLTISITTGLSLWALWKIWFWGGLSRIALSERIDPYQEGISRLSGVGKLDVIPVLQEYFELSWYEQKGKRLILFCSSIGALLFSLGLGFCGVFMALILSIPNYYQSSTSPEAIRVNLSICFGVSLSIAGILFAKHDLENSWDRVRVWQHELDT